MRRKFHSRKLRDPILHLPQQVHRMQLVLLPGMDGTGDLFEPLIAALQGKLQCKVIPYPANKALSYAELVKHVVPQLPEREEYVILGESFSGPIAVMIAESNPRNLIGLILCATFARNPRPNIVRATLPFIGLGLKLSNSKLVWRALLGRYYSHALCNSMQTAIAKVDSKVLIGRIGEIRRIDVTAAFATLVLPILYLKATDDRLVPTRACDYIVGSNARIGVRGVPGPHFLLQSSPIDCAREILEFCGGIDHR